MYHRTRNWSWCKAKKNIYKIYKLTWRRMKLSFWMIRSEKEFHSSTFRCSIGVAFFIGEYFPNVARQAMKVPTTKSIPPLSLHGSSTFTIDHSLYSSDATANQYSSIASSFRFYPFFGLYQWIWIQYTYTIYMLDFTTEHGSNLSSIWRDRVKYRNKKIKTG